MEKEKFYQKLSEIPEAPDLFDRIEKELFQKKTQKKPLIPMVATLLLAVGILVYANFYKISQPVSTELAISEQVLSQEVIDEFQLVRDFFSDTVNEYSLLDMYVFLE